MKSSLAKFMPESINCFELKKSAWINDRILVLTAEQQKKLSEREYDMIRSIGERFYGERKL